MPHSRKPSTPPGSAAAPTGLPNGDPVLLTRLRPPWTPTAFLRRDRLVRRLDTGVQLPLTLVNGPAGAGKTLLVADWLSCGRLPGPAAWLSLEEGDNLPGNFWTYVRETLLRSVPDLPAEIGVPAEAEHVDPSMLNRLAAWINSLPQPVVLVLDEFEQIVNPELTSNLHDLIRHTEGQLRVVLISRNEPLLPLHRYRAAGRLTEVRATDLALSLSEAADVLERHGLHPSAATVEEVHRKLSGWTVGLRLVALAAQGSEAPDAYLKSIDSANAVSDFLLTEVLHAQPKETQDLLLRCSILNLIHPDLADSLTGRHDGYRILAELHQANAFTKALPETDWYRLHPMFAGILRLHLKATAPGRLEALHVCAAHWLADHGQHRNALVHAAQGGAWGFAARLLVDRLALVELFAGREVPRLRALFSDMPPSARSPAAEVVRAALDLAVGDVATATAILERVEPHLLPKDTCLQLAASFLRAETGRMLGSASLADSAARRAHELEHAAPRGPLAEHPELLPQVDADLGSALLSEGRLSEASLALSAAAQAPLLPATARLRHDSVCRLAFIDYLQGWPGRAEKRVRQADDEAERASLPPHTRTEVGNLVLAAAALERDDLAAAHAALVRVEASAQSKTDPAVALGRGVIRATLHLARHDPAAALKVLEDTRRHDLADHPSDWGRERLAVTASAAHLAAGRSEAAVKVLLDVEARAPDSIVATARARLAVGRDQSLAIEQLHALRDDPTVGSATRTRALLLLAQAESPHGETSSGRLLRQALTTAEAEQLRRPFRESAGWVRRELRRHPQLAQAHPWLPDDLCPSVPSRAAVGPRAHADRAAEPLTERECEVLARAARMMSTQEIAEDLFLSPNTVKTHLKTINRKLATTSRREAVREATRLQLLDAA